MHEWLRGGAPPCQGGGRGFDPRLALEKITGHPIGCPVIFFEPNPGLEGSMSSLRSGPRKAEVRCLHFFPVYLFIFKIVFPVMLIHFTHDPAGISHGNYI